MRMLSRREYLFEKSKELRKNMTEVEKKLWYRLNAAKLGYHFYRQRIIDDRYIVDFCCADKKLIIELDGG